MKRKFDEISNEEIKENGRSEEITYGRDVKRRKIEGQKIGELMIDAKKAFYFKIASKNQKEEEPQYFNPLFMTKMFGGGESISGYENLNVEVTLSSKRLFPLVTISYSKKAPAFANVHNLEEIIQKEWGKYSKTQEEFDKILEEEADPNFKLPEGEKVVEFKIENKEFVIIKVCLENESFHEQSFYLQAVLPFFIDGASVIEPWPFWNYFMIYEKETGNLAGYTSVYEAHLTAFEYRTKISQVLILPTYQRKGLGVKMYETIYRYYQDKPECLQLLVEDSAEDFQRIQDVSNTKFLLEKCPEIAQKLQSLPMSGVIQSEEDFKSFLLKSARVKEISKLMKLQEHVILRINDLMIFGFLDNNPKVVKAYANQLKRKFCLRIIKQQVTMINQYRDKLIGSKGGLQKPYLYSSLYDRENPFFNSQSVEEIQAQALQQMCQEENLKKDVEKMFEEQMQEFVGTRMKIKGLLK